jgi:hypothetical protein
LAVEEQVVPEVHLGQFARSQARRDGQERQFDGAEVEVAGIAVAMGLDERLHDGAKRVPVRRDDRDAEQVAATGKRR